MGQKYAQENGKYLGQIYDTTLAEANLSGQYDIVVAFHSLYQFPRNPNDTIDGLEKASAVLKEEGLGVVCSEFSVKDAFQKVTHLKSLGVPWLRSGMTVISWIMWLTGAWFLSLSNVS